ncbi:MAG: MraY family glycosyltransferase [Janthinobacterium lividum]
MPIATSFLSSLLPLGLATLWALVVALFAVPAIVYVAHLKQLLDVPNERTVHRNLTPRLGGVAVLAGFFSALTIFAPLGHGVQQLLAGCLLLFFVGLKDDLVTISVTKKFVGQLLATGVVLVMADVRITTFQGLLGIGELPVGISYGFTFLVVVGITNAINLIDGLDGLAGTLVGLMCVCFGYAFFCYGGAEFGGYAYVAVCLLGGLLGFLRHNFHRAKIFLGDTGSLVCGFIVAVLAIQFIEMGHAGRLPAGAATPVLALAILFVPLFDTIRVFLVRLAAGRSPFSPDKNHVHHCLLALGCSQVSTVLLLGLLQLSISALVVSFLQLSSTVLLGGLLAVGLALGAFLGINRVRIS